MTVTQELRLEHNRVIKEVLDGVRKIFKEQNETIKELGQELLRLQEEINTFKKNRGFRSSGFDM